MPRKKKSPRRSRRCTTVRAEQVYFFALLFFDVALFFGVAFDVVFFTAAFDAGFFAFAVDARVFVALFFLVVFLLDTCRTDVFRSGRFQFTALSARKVDGIGIGPSA